MQTGKSEEYPPPAGINKIEVPIPDYAYDYFFKLQSVGSWDNWSKLLQGGKGNGSKIFRVKIPF